MSIIQGNTKVSAAGGYEIDQSIRFNDNDSAYLSRTLGSADSERKFASVSMWLKRSNLTSRQNFYSVNGAGSTGASNQISMAFENSGTNGDSITYNNGAVNRQSTSVYRDVSGWYHFVQIFDTTQATAADRVKTYINGVLLTDLNIGQDFSLNSNTPFGQSGVLHYIGRRDSGFYYDGYMAEIVFTVGQSVAVTDFGEYNADGVWVPKAYAGTYGTNGFYITGENSADLGADYSGNGNDFTSSGLTSDDQVTDTPTENYATWNVLDKGNVTLSDGNLYPVLGADWQGVRSTFAIPTTGKWYWEITPTTVGYIQFIGLCDSNKTITSFNNGSTSNRGWGYGSWFSTYNGNVTKYQSDVVSSGGTNWTGATNPTNGDILMVAYDADNGSLWFGREGTWFNSSGTANPATNTDPRFSSLNDGTEWFASWSASNTYAPRAKANFGQLGFAYTPPTGFSALSTANLPAPTIADGSAYFQTTTYTGAGYPTEVNQSGNSTFQPDFVWIKRRNAATQHDLFDAVRGVSSQLYTSLINAEGTVSNAISFDADGFTAVADPITGDTGSSGNTFVGWQWLAANGTASNTNGSITSTVSANTTAGFSIITWTGNGASGATIGHGLSSAPEFFIVKNRSNNDYWAILETAYYGATHYLTMPSTSGSNPNSTFWTNTAPTSSVITLGTQNRTNGSSDSMVGYAFHSVEGFSKVGKYTGNGSADGPSIYTGFKPAFVIIKRIDGGVENWQVQDSTRNSYNVIDDAIYAASSAAEVTNNSAFYRDFLSNGFKIRASHAGCNASGGTYLYMAFAEHPFGGDGVAPVPAR